MIASLLAIAIPGVSFAVTTALDGAPGVGALFLLPVAAAYATSRAIRFARAVLVITALGALSPLGVGVVMTWPDLAGGLPYVAGATAIAGGLCGLFTPSARGWYAEAIRK